MKNFLNEPINGGKEGFEPSVHLMTHDELATRWFKPAHPLSVDYCVT